MRYFLTLSIRRAAIEHVANEGEPPPIESLLHRPMTIGGKDIASPRRVEAAMIRLRDGGQCRRNRRE